MVRFRTHLPWEALFKLLGLLTGISVFGPLALTSPGFQTSWIKIRHFHKVPWGISMHTQV